MKHFSHARKMICRCTFIFLAVFLSGCSSHLSSRPADAVPLPPPVAGELSPKNTQITFVGSATFASHEGTFTRFSGTITTPDADPGSTRVRATIEMDSVYTQIPLLTKHLKDADFFGVVTYPTASFVSARIEPAKSADGDYSISGNLTLHGVTRSITFPARVKVDSKIISIDARISILQSDFGMRSAKTTTNEVPVTVSARVSR